MQLTVVILTKNESLHIERAIDSVSCIAKDVYVIDSGSTDNTRDLALSRGAKILDNPWINYATQFNWALSQLPADTQWVFRLDADEYVTSELANELTSVLSNLSDNISAIFVPRRMHFMGRRIEWGGVFPVKVARIFRFGRGYCENRWMDEHIIFDGPAVELTGELIDDNLNSISWWTEKHNSYASREVVDLLNLEFDFMPHQTVASLRDGHQAGVKRWLKERVYAHLPIGSRTFLYFIYRFIIRLGVFDGPEGRAFHVLQGFWYRYLVDLKLREVKNHMAVHDVGPVIAIDRVLGIKI